MNWVTRIIQGLLVVGFIASGIMKLTANPMLVQTFASLGYSYGMMYFVGACEVLGAIGLLVGFWKSKLGLLASGCLVILMAGAVYTHLKAGQGFGSAMPSLVLLVLSLFVFIGRRKSSKEA